MPARPSVPLLLSALALCAVSPALAQGLITGPAAPTLVVTEGASPGALEITALDVQARVVGHLAETAITMTFFNGTGRVLAGDLTFPLPPGSTVSGYALDVDGVLVDGVVVDKVKARQVFEAEVRKGVDPGLVEQVAGAAYRTRVFPIPAKGSRTVRVSYVSELTRDPRGARYDLPLGFDRPIKDVHVRLEVVKATEAPQVDGDGLKGLDFGRWEDSFVAETRLKDALLHQPIAIVLPDLVRRPVAVERAPDGHVYFAIHDHIKAPSTVERVEPSRVTILWDASLSRANADHDRELGLLRAWMTGLAPRRVQADVAVFADALAPTVTFQLPGQAEALLAHLGGVVYDGGTRMAALEALRAGGAPDLTLLFSDGISNLGEVEAPQLAGPLYAINGASIANHDALRALAVGSGGAWIDLSRLDDAAAIEQIGRAPFAFRALRAPSGLGECHPQIAEPVDGPFSFAGRLESGEATVTLRFEGAGGKPVDRTFTVRASDAVRGTLLQRFWAQKKVADLAVGGRANEGAIVAVGKEFGIVTAGTSLLVLERLDQYVEHDIRPPSTLPKMAAAWDVQKAEAARRTQAVAAQKLERIVALWTERVEWWAREFDLTASPSDGKVTGGARPPSAASGAMRDDDDEDRMMAEESEMAADIAPARSAAGAGAPSPKAKKSAKEESSEPAPPPPPSISLQAWDPATPYLAALKAVPASQRLATYLTQRERYGTSPAFFLDCADYFLGQGERARGLRILSNIVELDLEDPALLRVLAHRLTQIEALDLAILTFERVAALRPDEPQSHRDLALALARRAEGRATDPAQKAAALADFQRAIDGLSRVVMDEWERFAEIELLALVELNNILAKAQRLGSVKTTLDKRLLEALDMDVRIVMSWDADMTDMDLHVQEPSGEEAYYGHARTRIGGRVSRDFTQGYGPEEYSIRAAMKGTYTVRTKFFGSSAAALQGAVTLYLDLYTDYGRPTEQRQSVTIRLAENKETFTIGEITFAGAARVTGPSPR